MGLDAEPGNPIYAAYNVNRGGCHLFLADSNGVLVWHIIDPMYWDEGLLRAVVQRILEDEG